MALYYRLSWFIMGQKILKIQVPDHMENASKINRSISAVKEYS